MSACCLPLRDEKKKDLPLYGGICGLSSTIKLELVLWTCVGLSWVCIETIVHPFYESHITRPLYEQFILSGLMVSSMVNQMSHSSNLFKTTSPGLVLCWHIALVTLVTMASLNSNLCRGTVHSLADFDGEWRFLISFQQVVSLISSFYTLPNLSIDHKILSIIYFFVLQYVPALLFAKNKDWSVL